MCYAFWAAWLAWHIQRELVIYLLIFCAVIRDGRWLEPARSLDAVARAAGRS